MSQHRDPRRAIEGLLEWGPMRAQQVYGALCASGYSRRAVERAKRDVVLCSGPGRGATWTLVPDWRCRLEARRREGREARVANLRAGRWSARAEIEERLRNLSRRLDAVESALRGLVRVRFEEVRG